MAAKQGFAPINRKNKEATEPREETIHQYPLLYRGMMFEEHVAPARQVRSNPATFRHVLDYGNARLDYREWL